ncbi:hypothetical protein [Isoptericola dokdonensis]|jgi:hypothetical protein|uniref:DUF2076 domain-containing protein n=1 Tax=Isoptericola dokdonensis DS-3 TaxID=1300344 RepID=A0A161IJD1_9MICO|nr:hypothetical protein [Isoptericola dokdonensis]ANC32124.1 hypothetical protein I598_2590 [Isoptericola dokdonensis DS-3]
MGFLDRLLGRSDDRHPSVPGMTGGAAPRGYASPTQAPQWQQQASPGQTAARNPDDVAIDRYRYLLRTAPPDAVEQAHAEAFAQLTPEQRRQVLTEVGATLPPSERATSDDPQSLARMATRAELRNPGTLEKSFRGGAPGGMGFGSMVGSSLLGTVAGVVIGSAVANMLFGPAFGDPSTPVAEDAAAAGDEGAGVEDAGATDAGADGGGDVGAADAGADEGLFGGFFGGDGGGGDFGGGDFGGF